MFDITNITAEGGGSDPRARVRGSQVFKTSRHSNVAASPSVHFNFLFSGNEQMILVNKCTRWGLNPQNTDFKSVTFTFTSLVHVPLERIELSELLILSQTTLPFAHRGINEKSPNLLQLGDQYYIHIIPSSTC